MTDAAIKLFCEGERVGCRFICYICCCRISLAGSLCECFFELFSVTGIVPSFQQLWSEWPILNGIGWVCSAGYVSSWYWPQSSFSSFLLLGTEHGITTLKWPLSIWRYFFVRALAPSFASRYISLEMLVTLLVSLLKFLLILSDCL